MKAHHKPLRSLDLFSGIGGLTLALHGLAEPLVYCDIEAASRAVLHDNMKLGRLPTAVVSTDVTQLDPAWIKQNAPTGSPEAIVAGFPCVGFSSVGKHEGFQNPATSLFNSILRLVDILPSVRWLFLENVPQILKSGMSHVVHELHTRRGFN
jgi:site-specific DNA-cytosine methylase